MLKLALSFSLSLIAFLYLYAGRYDAPPRAVTFLDREGELLGTLDPSFQGLREWVPLSEIPAAIVRKTIRSEDRFFYWHRGINPFALAKATFENLAKGRIVRGGSTITQQLAKNLMGERKRTFFNKFREALLALGLEVKHPKSWILERYLNGIYYGHRSYGIAAASRVYFGKVLGELSSEEIDFLVARPKAPSRFARTGKARCSLESGGGTAPPPDTPHLFTVSKPVARHFLEFVSQNADTAGNLLQTTLDRDLQVRVEEAVRQTLAPRVEGDLLLTAAVVVIDVQSGEILVLVGSRDYLDERIQGQVNAAVALRQPGSTLKPFTYFAAFSRGFGPLSIVPDEPFSFHSTGEDAESYAPQNFDRRYHGEVTIREALANSYNVPAVVALNEIGLSYYHDLLRRFGFTTLNRPPPHYGLSVTLGSGEVTLLELTNAYAALARGGRYLPYRFVDQSMYGRPQFAPGPVPSKRFSAPPQADPTNLSSDHPAPRDFKWGRVARGKVYDGAALASRQNLTEATGPAQLIVSNAPKFAAQVTEILSDPVARLKGFGFNEAMSVEGHKVAVKTGTSYDHRDNWTVGYSPSYAVGVWVGHADGSPMDPFEMTGATGAAPLWHAVMEILLRGRPAEKFPFLEVARGDDVPRSMPRSMGVQFIAPLPNGWKILQPVSNAVYRLQAYLPREHQKILASAVVGAQNFAPLLPLRWFLDGRYLESTRESHPRVWIPPELGPHRLRVESSDGQFREINFRVENPS